MKLLYQLNKDVFLIFLRMNIIICDDHKIVRDGLRQILLNISSNENISEAADGEELIKKLKLKNFDIVLLDISLPNKNGLEILQQLIKDFPSVKVLMLSMFPQKQYALRAFKFGASAYLTKDATSEELITAIKKIQLGGKYISASLAESLAESYENKEKSIRHEKLSEREFEIMLKLANGQSMTEIADLYFISYKTVSTYRSRIMKKMNMITNFELTKYCYENSLI